MEKDDEKFYTDEANRNGGRYQLGLAAMFIASRANAGVDSMMRKLFEAAGAGELIVYERGMDEVYRFTPDWKSNAQLKDNEAFLEAKWNDLNDWLEKKEPGVFKAYQFPEPDAPAGKGKAVPIASPSDEGWATKACAIADKLALERYQRGEREITARNISDAVASKLAKDSTTHGTRGERSAGNIRNTALKGWKFIPPTGTNGTSGTKK